MLGLYLIVLMVAWWPKSMSLQLKLLFLSSMRTDGSRLSFRFGQLNWLNYGDQSANLRSFKVGASFLEHEKSMLLIRYSFLLS
jgi:hypothetical protein